MTNKPLKVLLIEDDEDDFLIASGLLSEMEDRTVELEWIADYHAALRAIEKGRHDVCLMDYGLGEHNGLELLREAMKLNHPLPVIMLTNQSAYGIDTAAMEAGAADYLLKSQMSADLLTRTIRHALQRANVMEMLCRFAGQDELTGLYNRRTMLHLLKEEAERSCRYGRPLSLVILDVDHFKTVNDSYGHLIGDEVLQWLAQLIGRTVRSVDIPSRYGGEEFAIMLPESTGQQALRMAERLRCRVASSPFCFGRDGNLMQLSITISLGVAALPTDAFTAETLLAASDQGLYAAKQKGRNCSVCFCDLPEKVTGGTS